MKQFTYSNATQIEEVLGQLGAQQANIRPLAGGTDLITLMKTDIVAPSELVNLKQLTDLPKGIEQAPDELQLGALTTLSAIEQHEGIKRDYAALAEAASLAATPQLRNMATIGGNLLQRPRCWYFRHPDMHCWLKGGEECYARDGENQLHALFGDGPCYATHPSDLAPALLALDAQIDLRSSNGERSLPLADFFHLPDEQRRSETELGDDELVLRIRLPKAETAVRSTYLKAMDRKLWAFALVGVAVALQLHPDGTIADAKIVLSGVAPIPWQCSEAEQLLIGKSPDATLFSQVADSALAQAKALSQNAYKLPLAHALITRALSNLTIEYP